MPAGASRWNVSRQITALSSPIVFPTANGSCLHSLKPLPPNLGIRHKLIRPYTPRHNGKVERSHREDQKRFYSCHSFYLPGRLCKAACCPQPPLQQLPYETPRLAFSLRVRCPICLTNLEIRGSILTIPLGWSRITRHVRSVCACSSVDRVPGYEPVGRRFESCQARQAGARSCSGFFYFTVPF